MNPSAELKDVMLRWYESVSAGEVAAVERLLSHQDGVLAIGTDPNEWWADYETIVRVHQVQFQEMGGKMQVEAGDLTTFAEGTVGWAADRPTFRLPDGQALPFRVTAVFHKEDGQWKIVQFHASFGVPNTGAVGSELTVS